MTVPFLDGDFMASISKRINADGAIVYRIRVHGGRNSQGKQRTFQTTWAADPKKTAAANEKALAKFAAAFEVECKAGSVTLERHKFGEYALFIINLKRSHGELKNSTAERYLSLLPHLNDIDGQNLDAITPQMLTGLYEKLLNTPALDSERYVLRPSIEPLKITKSPSKAAFCRLSGIAHTTLNAVLNGDNVTRSTAEKMAAALSAPVSTLFTVKKSNDTLSAKTVRELHVLIGSILDEAMHDGIINANPARRARLPKIEKHEADFLEPDEIASLLQAADHEPLQTKILIYLLVVSGGRRGEVLGLRWKDINFNFCQLHFDQTVLYRKNLGLYLDSPKNEKSNRFIKIPHEMIKMLDTYKTAWEQHKLQCGSAYPPKITLPNGDGQPLEIDTDFLFLQSRRIGYPMHPDTVNDLLARVAQKANLRHVHPHMLRHSAASTLIFSGLDIVSVAGYLGHANPTTTVNILYGHTYQSSHNSIKITAGDNCKSITCCFHIKNDIKIYLFLILHNRF